MTRVPKPMTTPRPTPMTQDAAQRPPDAALEALATALLNQEPHTCSDDMRTCAAAIYPALAAAGYTLVPAAPAAEGLRDFAEWAEQVQDFTAPEGEDEAYRLVSTTDLRILRDFAEQARAALAAAPPPGAHLHREWREYPVDADGIPLAPPPAATLDAQALADAMNEYEVRAGKEAWPVGKPGTHRADCIHVGFIADVYARLAGVEKSE